MVCRNEVKQDCVYHDHVHADTDLGRNSSDINRFQRENKLKFNDHPCVLDTTNIASI